MKANLEINIDDLAKEIIKGVVCAIKPLLIKNKEDDTIFDVAGLAEYLKVSTKWIYERTQYKEIPYYKVKGLLRFKKSEIDKWLTTYKVPTVSMLTRPLRAVK